MNVVLIRPPSTGFDWTCSHSVGLSYLASFIRNAGHKVSIIDAKLLGLTLKQLLGKIREMHFDVIGVSAMTHEFLLAQEICATIKKVNPDIITVLGGPHATARPEETLDEIKVLDVVIAGEGEIPMVKMLERITTGSSVKELQGINGIAYRKGNEILWNGFQQEYLNLEMIPQPAVDLYYTGNCLSKVQNNYYITFYRGCPFQCAFCSKALGRTVRHRLISDLISEWTNAVYIYGSKHISVIDEIFFYNNSYVHQILDELIERKIYKSATFSANIHVNTVNEDLLLKAKKAGCIKINIGIESGNNKILSNSHRPYTIDKAKQSVSTIHATGIKVHSYFILGHPEETHKTIHDTIKAAISMNTFEVGIGVMVAYPGTKVYKLAVAESGGYKIRHNDWTGYDRFGGSSLIFENVSMPFVLIYQFLGYVLFYVINFRFADMMKYFFPRLAAIMLSYYRLLVKMRFRYSTNHD